MRYRYGAAAVAMLGLASPAFADAWDFIITNNTGKEITLIEVSADNGTTWQKNKVDEGDKPKNLKVAGRGTIHFDKTAAQCRFQIRATYTDNSTAVFPAVNVCDNSAVVIRYNGANPVAVAS